MTPRRLRELLAGTRLDQREAAALIAYKNHNSIRQCLNGEAPAALPPGRR